jgi:hypothetical protein
VVAHFGGLGMKPPTGEERRTTRRHISCFPREPGPDRAYGSSGFIASGPFCLDRESALRRAAACSRHLRRESLPRRSRGGSRACMTKARVPRPD